ncbi:MAG: hypothetical protein NT147_04160 [Candidatus Aminicenantes bacterium]|nr:hypothetical protein [Candidatus Aminicenantes bacterium]
MGRPDLAGPAGTQGLLDFYGPSPPSQDDEHEKKKNEEESAEKLEERPDGREDDRADLPKVELLQDRREVELEGADAVLQEPGQIPEPLLVFRKLGRQGFPARIDERSREVQQDEHQGQDEEDGRRPRAPASGQERQDGVDDIGEENGQDERDEHGPGQFQDNPDDEKDDDHDRRFKESVFVQVIVRSSFRG